MGSAAMEKLKTSKAAVFGIGGVGGFAAEALARCGVGRFELIDNDVVSISNINRQIVAKTDTIGKPKAEVMAKRIYEINPQAEVKVKKCFFMPENADEFDFGSYDYVVDAVDTVTAKIEIIMQCKRFGAPVISCMGTGNKLDPARLKVADIYKTSVCPLARVMRRELKKRGVEKLKVVYSDEEPVKIIIDEESRGRHIPGSVSFVPSVAGLIIGGEVVKDLAGYNG